MPLPQVCVTYLLREGAEGTEVLLGRKKRGLGAGKLVGLGGKLRPGEHPQLAAIREIEEESGIFVDPEQLRLVALLTYIFATKASLSQESWVYVCREWVGDPVETDEIAPEWFSLESLPVERMWSDARHWLRRAIGGSYVRASYVFGADLHTAVASDDPHAALPSLPPPESLR